MCRACSSCDCFESKVSKFFAKIGMGTALIVVLWIMSLVGSVSQ